MLPVFIPCITQVTYKHYSDECAWILGIHGLFEGFMGFLLTILLGHQA